MFGKDGRLHATPGQFTTAAYCGELKPVEGQGKTNVSVRLEFSVGAAWCVTCAQLVTRPVDLEAR